MTRVEVAPFAGGVASERNWQGFYIVGATAALLALAGTLMDIIVATLPGWETTTTPATIQAWYTQFQVNPLLGLRNLDLLNVIVSAIGIPMYLALYGAHRRSSQASAMLALMVVLVGTVVFLTSNVALPMLELSRGYAAAATDAQRVTLEAAGAALLARGAHGSMGAFMGFFLSSLGTLLLGVAMLRGRVFGRAAGWLAVVGAALMAGYTVGTTFAPTTTETMMALAVPGGLLVMAWNVIVAVKLLRLAAAR